MSAHNLTRRAHERTSHTHLFMCSNNPRPCTNVQTSTQPSLSFIPHIHFLFESRCLRPTGRKSRPKLLAQRESQSKWLTPPRDQGSIYAMPCGTLEIPDTRHESVTFISLCLYNLLAMNHTKFLPSTDKPKTILDRLSFIRLAK